MISLFFFFNDTATTEIYTLSLHDALPICHRELAVEDVGRVVGHVPRRREALRELALRGRHRSARPVPGDRDRKSTRLNSSHANISYAVFCLKKKKSKTHNAMKNNNEKDTK